MYSCLLCDYFVIIVFILNRVELSVADRLRCEWQLDVSVSEQTRAQCLREPFRLSLLKCFSGS